jgi:hypothetical protein
MQYLNIEKPTLLYQKVPILLFPNFIKPLDNEKKEIYQQILTSKDKWKVENNWKDYMSSYGVPGELSFCIPSTPFSDDLYKKFVFTLNQYLRTPNLNVSDKIIKIRCLNSYDPHYVWNSILNENDNSIVGMYCFFSNEDPEESVQIDFEYKDKLLNYTINEYDLLVFPKEVDYAIRPPLTNTYQVIFNFGINTISNIKKVFIDYI